ncbi:MAG: nucleotidyltransferase domain-containing protein [Rhodobacteraceae bacterium]|nr:nucleotidyltransferase domain-containing protein [Paracoccaceae bacterium]
MHQLIASKQKEIATICRRHSVERLELFGSAARGTDFDPLRSDIDFLVEYEPPLLPRLLERRMQLQDDLQEVMNRKVDLVRKGTIGNPYLQETIDEDREVVFEE